jgi:hypothetical protein
MQRLEVSVAVRHLLSVVRLQRVNRRMKGPRTGLRVLEKRMILHRPSIETFFDDKAYKGLHKLRG